MTGSRLRVRAFSLGAALSLSVATPADAPAQSLGDEFRSLAVRSCAAADSLLGPLGADRAATVRGRYDASAGKTILVAGPDVMSAPITFNPLVTFDLFLPYPVPPVTLQFRLGGAAAAPLIEGSQAAQIRLDDSLSLGTQRVVREIHSVGEIRIARISIALPHLSYRMLVRAGRARLTIGSWVHEFSDVDRGNLRALYRLAICGTGP